MNNTALAVARQFIGVKEGAGAIDNPLVVGMLRLEDPGVQHDAVAWCSAFVNFVAWILDVPRSRSLAARSWLTVGRPVALADAMPGFDVVILQRGDGEQPGADVIAAPGHVGFYVGHDADRVTLLGGNQGDAVCVESFPKARVLGVRRLA